MTIRFLGLLSAAFLLAFGLTSPGAAQNREVPYWATVNTDELNLRVGPSIEFKIDWVYRREGLPVKVIRVVEGWWRIRDYEGTEGWVTANLMSKTRGAMVIGEGLAAIRDVPADNGKLKWNAAPGVVGRLRECEAGWCRIDINGRVGWIKQARLWGAGNP